MRSRDSSRSGAARSVRRRARRRGRILRESLDNTEHLPAAEGVHGLAAMRRRAGRSLDRELG